MLQRLILITLIGLMVPTLTVAESVYRWKDENGVVHFGDRQPTGKDSERVSVKSGRPSSTATRTSPQEQLKALEDQRAAESEKKRNAAREDARRKQREANCQTARSNLALIANNSRIRTTENGEQRYLTPEEIQAQKDRYQAIIEETCGEPDS